MRIYLIARLLACAPLLAAATTDSDAQPIAATGPPQAAEVLNKYFSASQQQQAMQRDSRSKVSIQARLPRLKKEGSLQAIRQVAASGAITYGGASGGGDKMVNKEVIARYLSAEAEASKGIQDARGNAVSIAISADNYRFRQKALLTINGQRIFIFQVLPRRTRLGLFRGEIWVDGQTGMPLREAGRLVKSPSVFLKKVDFVREYDIRGGVSYPARVESVIETRLVGRAELVIQYSDPDLSPTALNKVPSTEP